MNNPSDIWEFLIHRYVKPGDTVIDATAGNGNDTLRLKQAVGSGKVYAFDIQQSALNATKALLLKENAFENVQLILDCHSRMDQYVTESVSFVIFNLGYLPKGDHKIRTQGVSSVKAIQKALSLLTADGAVCVTIYRGGDTGFDEEAQVLQYLQALDCRRYTVLLYSFINRPNNPPLTAVITPR